MNQETITTLWKKEFSKNKKEKFIWDNISWMQTKKDFIIKAYLISDYIKKIDWNYIWIMLPAVWSASLLIISVYLAWKTPVMFNWTLWKEAFDHCVNFSKVSKILTSSNFYDRVKNDFLEEYNTNNNPSQPSFNTKERSKASLIFLENLLKNISLKDKIKALIKSLYMPVPNTPLLDKEGKGIVAVILFTSGSESLPKAVPLTHKNLIENIKGSISIFELKNNDRLIWFLPPFHSFGFTINTIMPLITWLQTVYTPDPNDAQTILNIIKHTQITAITATPTFLKMIMNLASEDDLKNIKYAVVWAEKCPKEVFEKFKKLSPNWKILEWYGITECSPVVSINPIEWAKPWTVWKVIPNLKCRIIDVETQEDSEIWEQWMIYVSGSSIFEWYLDENLESPFEKLPPLNPLLTKEGKAQNEQGVVRYKTWDLWKLDTDGFLTITWRLKRFVKIAWEMISLPFIEAILLEKYGSEEELKIAVEALENEWEVKIILFTLEHIETDEVNDYMRKRGVSNLVKISDVIKIEEIPVLWTGKTDYKILKAMIK